jgi:hypothetical protein
MKQRRGGGSKLLPLVWYGGFAALKGKGWRLGGAALGMVRGGEVFPLLCGLAPLLRGSDRRALALVTRSSRG